MRSATVGQRHWWLSSAGRYGASRDDGGSDQGSVVVRTGCGSDGGGRGKGTQGYDRGNEKVCKAKTAPHLL